MPGFVHLHVHSSYSLLEGALTIARLAELAKADRQPALALTDTDNMFGALEFSDKMAAAGIQPIIGCALAVDFADQDSGPRAGTAAAARASAHRSPGRARERLSQPDAAQLARLPGNRAATSRRTCKLAWLEDESDGLDRADRRPGRPARCRDRRRPGATRDGRCEALPAAVRRPALHRAAAPRHDRGTQREAGAGRARLCARDSAGRHQRAVLRAPGGLRGP